MSRSPPSLCPCWRPHRAELAYVQIPGIVSLHSTMSTRLDRSSPDPFADSREEAKPDRPETRQIRRPRASSPPQWGRFAVSRDQTNPSENYKVELAQAGTIAGTSPEPGWYQATAAQSDLILRESRPSCLPA